MAQDAFGAFLGDLGTASAAARLIGLGTRVSLDGAHTMTFPARSGPPVAPAWVSEGGAIQVVQRPLANVTLGPPKKLAAIVLWSWEMDKHTQARAVFEQMLREDVAVGLDLAYFRATAGSASAHAGLLNGVTALAASTEGGAAAMQADLAAVIGAVTGVGSSGEAVVVTSHRNAALMPVHLPETAAQLTILGTSVLTDAQIVAIDPKSLAHSTDPDPEIFVTDKAVVHLEDTSPVAMAARTESLFQSRKGRVANPALYRFRQKTIRCRGMGFRSGLGAGMSDEEHNEEALLPEQEKPGRLHTRERPLSKSKSPDITMRADKDEDEFERLLIAAKAKIAAKQRPSLDERIALYTSQAQTSVREIRRDSGGNVNNAILYLMLEMVRTRLGAAQRMDEIEDRLPATEHTDNNGLLDTISELRRRMDDVEAAVARAIQQVELDRRELQLSLDGVIADFDGRDAVTGRPDGASTQRADERFPTGERHRGDRLCGPHRSLRALPPTRSISGGTGPVD